MFWHLERITDPCHHVLMHHRWIVISQSNAVPSNLCEQNFAFLERVACCGSLIGQQILFIEMMNMICSDAGFSFGFQTSSHTIFSDIMDWNTSTQCQTHLQTVLLHFVKECFTLQLSWTLGQEMNGHQKVVQVTCSCICNSAQSLWILPKH